MKKIDHSNTICTVCRTNVTSQWRRYVVNKEGKYILRYEPDEMWDGKSYICNICYGIEDRKRFDHPNNLIKSMSKCRNKQISKNTNTGKGYIGEQIWCKWRRTKNCNIEKDNFNSREDTIDPEYGIVQVKLAILNNGEWNVNIGQNHNFDIVGILFMDNKMKNVERLCIIPVKELESMTYLKIQKDGVYRNFSMAADICDRFYVNKKLCDDINNIYHSMSIEDCPVLKNE